MRFSFASSKHVIAALVAQIVLTYAMSAAANFIDYENYYHGTRLSYLNGNGPLAFIVDINATVIEGKGGYASHQVELIPFYQFGSGSYLAFFDPLVPTGKNILYGTAIGNWVTVGRPPFGLYSGPTSISIKGPFGKNSVQAGIRNGCCLQLPLVSSKLSDASKTRLSMTALAAKQLGFLTTLYSFVTTSTAAQAISEFVQFLTGVGIDKASNSNDKASIKLAALVNTFLAVAGSLAGAAFLGATGGLALLAAGLAATAIGAAAQMYALDPPDPDFEAAPVSYFQPVQFPGNPVIEQLLNTTMKALDLSGTSLQAYEKLQGALIAQQNGADTSSIQSAYISLHDSELEKMLFEFESLGSQLDALPSALGLQDYGGLSPEQTEIAKQHFLAPPPGEVMDFFELYGIEIPPEDLIALNLENISGAIPSFEDLSRSIADTARQLRVGLAPSTLENVPEPATLALLGLGFAVVRFARHRTGARITGIW